jgi:hypothetical protein
MVITLMIITLMIITLMIITLMITLITKSIRVIDINICLSNFRLVLCLMWKKKE